MRTINCAIIEDEPLGAKNLATLLKNNHPEIKVIAFAKTLKEAHEAFSDMDIDLFFADIELLDGNIFQVLDKIQLPKGKYIVFTTAYEEFGVAAFSYPALHYLMKPISPSELAKAIVRYKDMMLYKSEKGSTSDELDSVRGFGSNKLLLPTQNGASFLEISDIVRIQSANKYSIVYTSDKKQHIVVKPLSRFEEVLSDKGFIRVHDSHLINIRHVTDYLKGKGGEVVMSDKSQVPVSVRRKEDLFAVLKNII